MASKIRIVSDALNLLGQPPLNDLDPATIETISANIKSGLSNIYDVISKELLSSFPWHFCIKTQQLNKLLDTPIQDIWQNKFQLPGDLLTLYRVYPIGSDWDIYGSELYSNQTEIQIDYTFGAAESEFPHYFELALVYMMAANAAMLVTQNGEIAALWMKNSKEQISKAKAIDSQQATNKRITSNPLVNAHLANSFRFYRFRGV